MYCCSYCSFKCLEHHNFLKHVRRHEHETDFVVNCEKCNKTCQTVRQLRDHLRWHKVKADQQCHLDSGSGSFEERAFAGPSDHPRERSPTKETVMQTSSFLDRPSSSSTVYKSSWIDVADFVLSLQSQGVSKKHCEDIVDQFKKFGTQVEREVVGDDSIAPNSQSVAGLSNIDTAYKLKEFAKNERGYIAPESQFLSNTSKPVSQLVPMAKQISAALQCEDVYSGFDFLRGPQQTWRDVVDGSLHAHEKGRLQLILYFDEFNISNPIGNKTKKYSIGAIYYTFANMQKRASIQNIYLAMLFHSSQFKAHSKKDIFEPLVRELTLLETEGVPFVRDGKAMNIKCSLSMLLGDNKGCYQMAGYFTSFHRTSRICRFCHAKTSDIQSCFHERGFNIRTCQQYDSEISMLEVDEFDEEVQKIFGIRELCVFNQVPSFHCIERFPVDITHDLF